MVSMSFMGNGTGIGEFNPCLILADVTRISLYRSHLTSQIFFAKVTLGFPSYGL